MKKRKGKGNKAHIVTVHEDLFVGIPLNPMARTVLIDRGMMWRWYVRRLTCTALLASDFVCRGQPRRGPDRDALEACRRRSQGQGGEAHRVSGKPVLEFIAIERKDGVGWAIPEGMVDMELCEERIGGKELMTLADKFA